MHEAVEREDGKPTGRPHLTGVVDHQAVDLLRSEYLPKIGSTDGLLETPPFASLSKR